MKIIGQGQSNKKRTRRIVRNGLFFVSTFSLLTAASQSLFAHAVSNQNRSAAQYVVVHKSSTYSMTFHAPKKGALVVHTKRKTLDIKWAQLEQTTTKSGRVLTTIQFKLWNGKSSIEVIGPIDAQHAVTLNEKRAVLVAAIKAAEGDSSATSFYPAHPTQKVQKAHSVQAIQPAGMLPQPAVMQSNITPFQPQTFSGMTSSQQAAQQKNNQPVIIGSTENTVVANNVTMSYATPNGKTSHRLGLPNPSLAAPNAFGGRHPTVFASLGYDNHWDGGTTEDGNMGLGISFGDPRKYLGVLVSVNNDTLGFRNESFGQNGGFGLRLNRYVAKDTALALGATNLPGWGAFANTSQNYYFAVTQGIRTKLPITLNAGLGTGDFSMQGATTSITTDSNIGGFLGAGIEVYRNLSLITDWADEELNVGASYGFLIAKLPIFLSAGMMNVTEAHGADYHWQLSAAVAYKLNV